MAIYEVSADKLRKVEETSFGTAGLGERADLQRLLRDQVTEVPWCINTGKSLIPLTLLFFAQKRNLLIPLEGIVKLSW